MSLNSNNKAAILFVDDEPNIVRGLQRMLRHVRDEMEIVYANNGSEALEILGSRPIDVIVSDLRMPGMSGSQLLARVRNQYPHIVRMALSGQAEQDQILQLAISSHQYLSKPCEADYLCTRIKRVCAFNRITSVTPFLGHVCQITSLPSHPVIYDSVEEMLENDKQSIQRIGMTIAKDPGMATKVLQLTNSPFFGRLLQICDPVEAVTALGKDTLKSLILTENVFTRLSPDNIKKYSFDQLWLRSELASKYAARIAKAEGLPNNEIHKVQMAASLLDVSKLILFSCDSCLYEEVVNLCRKDSINYKESVSRCIELDEKIIPSYLLTLWGLSPDVVDMVGNFENPSLDPGCPNLLLAIVHCATSFSTERSEELGEYQQVSMDKNYIKSLNLSEKVDCWKRICETDEEQNG